MGSTKKPRLDTSAFDSPPPPPQKSVFLGMFTKNRDATLSLEEGPTSSISHPKKKAQKNAIRKAIPKITEKKPSVYDKVKQDHERIEKEQRRLMHEAEEKWRKREAHEQHIRNTLHRHMKEAVEKEKIRSEEMAKEHAKMHYHLTRQAFKDKVQKVKTHEKHRRAILEQENQALKNKLKEAKKEPSPSNDILQEMEDHKELVLTIPSPPKPLGTSHRSGSFASMSSTDEDPPSLDASPKSSWWSSLFGRKEEFVKAPPGLEEIEDEIMGTNQVQRADVDPSSEQMTAHVDRLPVIAPLLLESKIHRNMDFLVPSHEAQKHLKRLRGKEGKLKEKWSKKKTLYEQDPELHDLKIEKRAMMHETQRVRVEVPRVDDVPAIDWTQRSPKSEQEIRAALQSVAQNPESPVGKVERWIHQVEQAIEMHNSSDARNAYVEAMKVYLTLPEQDQQKVYSRLQSTYELRQRATA